MSAFGFDVPQGDPGALTGAAASWRGLGLALVNEGEAVTAASRAALGAGGWRGAASEAFVSSAERLISAFTSDADACARAAGALENLAHALQHAQQVTRQALAACSRSQEAASSHQRAANQAGDAATSAQQQAAAAAHPAARAALQHQADQARQQQTAAATAAWQASEELIGNQTTGQQAVSAYEHEAQAAARQLSAAAGELKGAQEVGEGWAKPLVSWLGHANDFGGAGAVGLIKGYEAALAVGGSKLASETESVLGNNESIATIQGGRVPAAFDGAPDPVWDLTKDASTLASNPVTRVLTAHPSEESFGLLGKVPYLAYGLTALDMYQERDQGVGKAVVEPLGNLAVSTAITEGTSAVVAPAIAEGAATLAVGDGTLAAIAGTAFVPGVGEVVIVGAAAVLGTYAVDKGVEWVWDHRAGIGHALETAGSATWHELESVKSTVTHTAGQVVHDIEPWHWHL